MNSNFMNVYSKNLYFICLSLLILKEFINLIILESKIKNNEKTF